MVGRWQSIIVKIKVNSFSVSPKVFLGTNRRRRCGRRFLLNDEIFPAGISFGVGRCHSFSIVRPVRLSEW